MTTQQQATKLSASSTAQVAPITAQSALAAIETFEIVGENNDSREPNADDRFILTEFIAHAFGGYPVEKHEAAPAEGTAGTRTLNVEDVRTAKETARQVYEGGCNHTIDAIEYFAALLEATNAARSCEASRTSQATAVADTGEAGLTAAVRDVLAERRRQVEAEGWTPEHDDEHEDCEMALAAIVYAESAVGYHVNCPDTWPWSPKWFKPTTPRRDLVKAGALILAEIERLDRTGEPQ
ncbi:hypothetical protein WK91_21240 [Burkholderia cepacia]|uniref:hypothetical protein n=1 Tax=Burkholderia cepacia TaxID=292 RepID=UPI00075A71B3|nr:hypothetical protein [Burkholderia cepacia]KVW13839.1 hypothetical protein WK91_21240 [Burkholderia cepacia]